MFPEVRVSTQSATYAASDAQQSRLAALLDEVSALVESDPARLPAGLSPSLAVETVRAYYAEVVPEDVLARTASTLR